MRTKEFRIAKRKKKIKARQKLAVQIARHGNVALKQKRASERRRTGIPEDTERQNAIQRTISVNWTGIPEMEEMERDL